MARIFSLILLHLVLLGQLSAQVTWDGPEPENDIQHDSKRMCTCMHDYLRQNGTDLSDLYDSNLVILAALDTMPPALFDLKYVGVRERIAAAKQSIDGFLESDEMIGGIQKYEAAGNKKAGLEIVFGILFYCIPARLIR